MQLLLCLAAMRHSLARERSPTPHPSCSAPGAAQGLLLTDRAERMDALNLLRYMAPLSLALLVPAGGQLGPQISTAQLAPHA